MFPWFSQQSEKKLRELNTRLDAALNNMTQGLCMFNSDEEVVVFNRRFLEMYKLSPQVVKPGCKLRELLQHRKDVGLLKEDPERFYQRIIADVRSNRTVTWIVDTADARSIQTSNLPMPGGGWVTTHEDVTERRRTEAQVREQKSQMDAALDNISQGLLMYSADGRLILCNRRYHEIYGLPRDLVKPGMTLQELLALRRAHGTFGRDPEDFAKLMMEALSAGKSMTFMAELADGRTIHIEHHPMRDGRWVSTHEDITERRNAEKQLAERKLHLDMALNTMSQGLNMFDADGRLVLWNERYVKMYGLSPDFMRPGRTVEELVRARISNGSFFVSDPERYIAQISDAIEKRTPGSNAMELSDGRTVVIDSQPTAGGGWVVTHEDVTVRRRTELERDRSQAIANTVIENVPTTLVVKDARTLRYVLFNRAAEEYYGMAREDAIGKTGSEIFPEKDAKIYAAHDAELLRTGETQVYDERPMATPGGGTRISAVTRMPIRDANGQTQYLLTMVEDRTHRRRAEAEIARLVHHDLLTGLPNRAAFSACIDATIESATKDDHSFAVMSVDFDRFKEINDVYGHVAGDELLRHASKRLQEAVGGAFMARLSGDEFVVIANDGEQPAAAQALADRLIAALDTDIAVNGRPLHTSVSVGVAIFPADGPDAATLIGNADAALYRAKADGRGTYRFFEAGMDKRLRERRVLQEELRIAIERDELALHYQPQARINCDIFGFEALARWQHPTRGPIPPDVFIPIAEENGLIVPMGEWIIREACREAASWTNPLQIAINLSPIQFRHGDLPAHVHSVLLETGLAPSRLELEITEGVLIDDFSRAVAVLRRLKALGVRIAMDDFGTGYSSLSYLQSFPFDKIKIDQAFISNLGYGSQSSTIVRAVIGLARGLEVPVLAEGVETKEQLAFLTRERCDEVQGYLIGHPMPIDSYAGLTGQPAKKRARAVR